MQSVANQPHTTKHTPHLNETGTPTDYPGTLPESRTSDTDFLLPDRPDTIPLTPCNVPSIRPEHAPKTKHFPSPQVPHQKTRVFPALQPTAYGLQSPAFCPLLIPTIQVQLHLGILYVARAIPKPATGHCKYPLQKPAQVFNSCIDFGFSETILMFTYDAAPLFLAADNAKERRRPTAVHCKTNL